MVWSLSALIIRIPMGMGIAKTHAITGVVPVPMVRMPSITLVDLAPATEREVLLMRKQYLLIQL